MKKQKRKMKVCQQGREDGNLGISFTQHLMMISKAEKSYIIRHLLLSLSSGKPVFGGAGEIYGTGPPGRAPNLGHFSSVSPDGYRNPPDRTGPKTEQHPILKAKVTAPQEVTLTTKGKICKTTDQPIENNKHRIQPIKNKMQIFLNIKFLKIMKKQILILALFALAILASTINSFGQALTVPSTLPPLPLPATCSNDALHPRAGIPYNYGVLINNAAALTPAPTGYTWWATQNPNFLDATHLTGDQTGLLTAVPGQLITTGPKYNDPTGAINMSITWSPEILALTKYHAVAGDAPKKSTFVAVLANGSCSNNLQVFEIDPKPAFTVDIASVKASVAQPFGTDVPQCVDQVRSAAYDPATFKVLMDYGTNTLYYEVVSANFVTNWTPTFNIMAGSLNLTQTADISWYPTLADAQASPSTNVIESFLAQVDGATVVGTKPLTTAISNTSAGVSVFVKVVIHNNKWESILANPFTLAVDGQDGSAQWDLDNSVANAASATPTCTAGAADKNDLGVQTITPRPDIIDNSLLPGPGGIAPGFVPKN